MKDTQIPQEQEYEKNQVLGEKTTWTLGLLDTIRLKPRNGV